MIKTFSLLVFCLSAKASVFTSAGMRIRVETVKTGLGIPWGIDFISPKTIIFTERKGNISLLDLTSKRVSALANVPKVLHRGQGGMLDVLVHPDFKRNKTIFFTYAKKVGRSRYTTALARAKLKGDKLLGVKDIFVAKAVSNVPIHFGSRILLHKGYLYVAVGDRHRRHKAQDLSVHHGKILRLKEDGSPAEGNPFAGKKGAAAEIWSYGHRNPQGLAAHPTTGLIWEQEHGPRGGDEINIIKKGGNYGWPVITYGREYWGPAIGQGTHKRGMIQPIKHFTPSIAPCGLAFYTGKALPGWSGSLFSGALKLRHLNRLSVKGDKVLSEERLLENLNERIRDIAPGPDGLIYLSTDSGKILRLSPAKQGSQP